MATNIPPHNLGETIDATCMMLDNPDVTTEELMKALPGPDFPTGGIIMGKKGILDAYETGRGSLTVRAKCEVQEKKNGKSCIVVSEIPYQVNRQRLLEKLGELVRDKKLPEISNIHDGADRHGIDIIIDLKSNAMPQVVLNKLFKHTQLQVGFGVIMLALVDGVPRVLSLKEMLHYYIAHQEEVIVRRTRYELAKAEERAHILEGYIIALDNIDEVIHIIRSSETDAEAAKRLTERFGLSKRQTDAILEMKLRRLTGLERTKIEEELDALREKIAYYKRVLSDDALVREIIKEELQEIKKKYGTSRKTRLSGDAKDIDVEDLIADENMVVTVTKAGYVKRLPVATYRQQKRGGKGMQGVNLKDNDYVEHLFVASTHAYMLFFSTAGKVYRLKVYELPEASRHARGTAIVNLLPLAKGETISAVIATKEFPSDEYLMFATSHGMVKKTSMELYDRTRRDGLIAINLKDGDELISVRRVAPGEKVIMVSSAGKAIMWDEDEVRGMGRDTMGVRGMNVPPIARVLGMEIAKPDTELFVITGKGLWQAHARCRVPRTPPWRAGRVHHHHDGEEGPVGRHEDSGSRRGDHDHVGGRRVRAYSRVRHFGVGTFHAGRARDERGRQRPRDGRGHRQQRQEEAREICRRRSERRPDGTPGRGKPGRHPLRRRHRRVGKTRRAPRARGVHAAGAHCAHPLPLDGFAACVMARMTVMAQKWHG